MLVSNSQYRWEIFREDRFAFSTVAWYISTASRFLVTEMVSSLYFFGCFGILSAGSLRRQGPLRLYRDLADVDRLDCYVSQVVGEAKFEIDFCLKESVNHCLV